MESKITMVKVTAPLEAETVNVNDYLPQGFKLKNVGYSKNPHYCNMLLKYVYDYIHVDPETHWDSISKAFDIKPIGKAEKKTVKSSFKESCARLYH